MQDHKLFFTKANWKKLVRELKKRGHGERESGAFLLGNPSDRTITDFICYNDLDPHCLDSGIIVFNGNGYIPLWNHCLEQGLKVLADVHTHPGGWTGQSAVDQQHPMIAQAGHLALIIPNFACNKNQLLQGVGVHEFLGSRTWKACTEQDAIVKLI